MAFGDKQRHIEHLEGVVNSQATEIDELRTIVGIYEQADQVTLRAAEILGSTSMRGVIDDDATAMAAVQVADEEKARLTRELSERIKAERGKEFAAEFLANEGEAVRTSLISLFQSDGTFDAIREDVVARERAGIRDEVVEAERQRIKAELSAEEERARVQAEIRAAFVDTDEYAALRARVRVELEESWAPDVRDKVAEQVQAEEEAREESFKAELMRSILASDQTADQRARIRAKLEETWGQATVEEVARQVEDEELKELLATLTAQEKDKLIKKTTAEKLLTDFEGTGIDVGSLEKGVSLEIFLGEYKTFKVKRVEDVRDARYQGRYRQQEVEKNVPGISVKRTLTLTSCGDGRFTVDGDSLLTSSSVYEQASGLHRGTTIVVGRKVVTNHDASLQHTLRADVPFYFDDDTTTDEIQDSLLTIANVKINGISARKIEHFEDLR